jgi:hypothetical protein
MIELVWGFAMNFKIWISRITLIFVLLGQAVSAQAETAFAYTEKSFDNSDRVFHLGVVYGISWALYPLFQPEVMMGDKGSWREYGENLGKTVYDQDEPFWNWIVHPISGSQLYLFYRAMGYARTDSFAMTFISSALFEYTIEIYSEPASYQDLYQTPVLGTAFGYGIELLSTELLNRPSKLAQFFGRVINPLSYIVDRDSFSAVPFTDFHSTHGVQLSLEF